MPQQHRPTTSRSRPRRQGGTHDRNETPARAPNEGTLIDLATETVAEPALPDDDIVTAAIRGERSRLARELHDGLAQHLASLKLHVAWLRRSPSPIDPAELSELESVLEVALAETRAAIGALRAPDHALVPVGDAIAAHATDFGQSSGLGVQVVQDAELPEVGGQARLELLRIVQEALHNTKRHARATRVDLEIRACGDGLEVTVRDDGRGFGGEVPAGHFGLAVMRERADSAGGNLEISAAEGAGTTIRVWIPAVSV